MLSYKDFIKYFGSSLIEKRFQAFLTNTFSDLTNYDVSETDYITSEINGIELGFTNSEAVYDDDDNIVFEKGNPVFSHFNLHPKSLILINNLPFDMTFNAKRNDIIKVAGIPAQTKEGYADLLNKNFLVDNYNVNDIVITFDYDPVMQTINFIQVRDNNLVEHLKL